MRGYDVKLTPEEEVRQETLARLFARGYVSEDLRVEFMVKLGSQRRSIDIGVFRRDVVTKSRHDQHNLFMVVECKRRGVSQSEFDEARDQLESYLAGSINATFGVVTDGAHITVVRKRYRRAGDVGGGWEFVEVLENPFGKRSRARTSGIKGP